MVRRVHCAAATFKHFRVWFLVVGISVKLSWAGGKSCPIGMGDFFQTLRTPRILLKWRGVASGCLFQRVVSQSCFCEIISWAVWKNDHLNSGPINFWGSHICRLYHPAISHIIFHIFFWSDIQPKPLPPHKNPRRCPTPVGFWHHPAEVLEWQLDANLPSRCQTTHSTKEVQRKSLYEQLVFFLNIFSQQGNQQGDKTSWPQKISYPSRHMKIWSLRKNPRLAAILYKWLESPWGSHHGEAITGVVSRNTGRPATAPLCVGFFNMTSLKGAEILDSMMLRYKEAWLIIDHEWRWLEMYFALNMRICQSAMFTR